MRTRVVRSKANRVRCLGRAGLVPGPDLVDERQGVAGDLRDLHDLAPDGGARAGVHAAGEPVEAGVLVGERRAAPGLHVAQVPPERRRPGPAQAPFQLLGRVAQVAHAVRHVLQAVARGAALGLGAAAAAEARPADRSFAMEVSF